MRYFIYVLCGTILTIFTQCETLKELPTNTSGTFSLNGNWQMTTTTDNRGMEGTIVTVVPGVNDATVRTLNNNNYCVRERDVIWRNITPMEGGTFTLDNLVNACDGILYKPATLTVVNNDEIRITGHNKASMEMVQTFKRTTIQQQ